jgi:hypothetical protein
LKDDLFVSGSGYIYLFCLVYYLSYRETIAFSSGTNKFVRPV